MSRTIVVGDLQGMREEAEQLLRLVDVQKGDRVIFAGDLVDRGPDSAGCLDLAREIEQRQGSYATVLGNHEEKHLRYRKNGTEPKIPSHIETKAQLTEAHYLFMEKMPLYIRLPEYNAVVVHAGCFPGRTIEQQDPYHLLHLQMINPRVSERTCWPSKVPQGEDGWTFWTNAWDGPERVIFGHSVLDKPLLTDKVCGIDGGACFGRQLHAVVLPEWKIYTVDATKDYGRGIRGRATEEEAQIRGGYVKLFPVHGDVSTFS